MSWDGGKSLLYPNSHSPPPWHTMVESGRGGTPLYVTLTLPAFASPPAPAHQTNKHLLRFPSFSRYIHPSTPLQTKLIIGETSSEYRLTQWASSSAWWKQPSGKCLLGLQLSHKLCPARYCVESSQPGEKFYCWESFTETRFSRIWMIQSLFPSCERKQNGASLGWMTLRGEKEEEEGEDFSLVWRIGLARSWYPRRTTNPLNPSLHVQLCNSAYCENIQQQINNHRKSEKVGGGCFSALKIWRKKVRKSAYHTIHKYKYTSTKVQIYNPKSENCDDNYKLASSGW